MTDTAEPACYLNRNGKWSVKVSEDRAVVYWLKGEPDPRHERATWTAAQVEWYTAKELARDPTLIFEVVPITGTESSNGP